MRREGCAGKPRGATVAWFTGLSGAGKSTIATSAANLLADQGRKVLTLDGDAVRSAFQPQLGFSIEDIYETNRRFIALCQKSMPDNDFILVPKISAFRLQRAIARRALGDAYLEVYIHASLEEVTRRDPKGLYLDAQQGRLPGLVGVAPEVPYEPPVWAELVLDTETYSAEDCAKQLADFLLAQDA